MSSTGFLPRSLLQDIMDGADSGSPAPGQQKIWPHDYPPSLLDQIIHGGGLTWSPPPAAPYASPFPPDITGGKLLAVPVPPSDPTAAMPGPANPSPPSGGQIPPGNGPPAVGGYYLPGLGVTYLDPGFADRLGTFITKAQTDGLSPTFVSGYRDSTKQASLHDDPTAVTPADKSLHSEGRAVDISGVKGMDPAAQAKLVADAASAGLSWGGNFPRPDPNHFYFDPGGNRQQRIDAFTAAVQALKNRPPDD